MPAQFIMLINQSFNHGSDNYEELELYDETRDKGQETRANLKQTANRSLLTINLKQQSPLF